MLQLVLDVFCVVEDIMVAARLKELKTCNEDVSAQVLSHVRAAINAFMRCDKSDGEIQTAPLFRHRHMPCKLSHL
jgi:hypothetical protein